MTTLARASLARASHARSLARRGLISRFPAVPGPEAIVAAGALDARATVSRASRESYFGADGALAEAANNVAAFDWRSGAARLQVYEARTNSVRNPRGEGGAGGTVATGGSFTGVLPTNWTHINHASGLSVQVTTGISHLGMTGVRLRYSGTTTASPGAETLEFEARGAIAAAAAAAWAGSFWYRLTAGSWPAGAVYHHRFITRNGSAAVVDNLASAQTAPDATLRRAAHAITTGAGVVDLVTAQHMTLGANTACDFTLEVFFPQAEAGAFTTPNILPTAGTPAAASRAADSISVPFASLFAGDAGTVLAKVTLLQAAPSSTPQAVAIVDDGTTANRWGIWNPSGTSSLCLLRVLAGSAFVDAAAGTFTAGTPIRVGMTFSAAGRAAISVNGGAARALTGGPASGLTTLRPGNSSALDRALNGEIETFQTLPFAATDYELQLMVAGIP